MNGIESTSVVDNKTSHQRHHFSWFFFLHLVFVNRRYCRTFNGCRLFGSCDFSFCFFFFLVPFKNENRFHLQTGATELMRTYFRINNKSKNVKVINHLCTNARDFFVAIFFLFYHQMIVNCIEWLMIFIVKNVRLKIITGKDSKIILTVWRNLSTDRHTWFEKNRATTIEETKGHIKTMEKKTRKKSWLKFHRVLFVERWNGMQNVLTENETSVNSQQSSALVGAKAHLTPSWINWRYIIICSWVHSCFLLYISQSCLRLKQHIIIFNAHDDTKRGQKKNDTLIAFTSETQQDKNPTETQSEFNLSRCCKGHLNNSLYCRNLSSPQKRSVNVSENWVFVWTLLFCALKRPAVMQQRRMQCMRSTGEVFRIFSSRATLNIYEYFRWQTSANAIEIRKHQQFNARIEYFQFQFLVFEKTKRALQVNLRQRGEKIPAAQIRCILWRRDTTIDEKHSLLY